MEVLVRALNAGPPQEVGDGRQLLGLQGLSCRAQPSLLPLEVDAALPRVRLAALHVEPLRDAGLCGAHTPGVVRGIREGVLDGSALRAAHPGAPGCDVP